MKKYNLFKILGLIFAAVVVLSWIIPVSTYTSEGFTLGSVTPFGLLDLVRLPLMVISRYIDYGIYLLVLGGFYGVINKTGVYTSLVEGTVKSVKKNKDKFLLIVAIVVALVSALTSLDFVLFIAVPFLMTVLLKLDFKRTTVLMATVGALLVGNFASLYGFDVSGYINYFFALGANQSILIKLIVFMLAVGLLLYFLMQDIKSKNPESYKEYVLFDKIVKKDKKVTPLIITFFLMFFFLIVATFNWKYGFNVSVFDSMYEDLIAIKIGEFAIFRNIIGSFNPLGYWGIAEIIMVLILSSAVIGWLYSLKFDEIITSFIAGAKELLIPALYVILANIIMVIFYVEFTNGTIFDTIYHWLINLTNGFNVFVAILLPIVGGLFHNDLPNLVYTMSGNITAAFDDPSVMPVVGLSFQMLHSLLMILLPTSMILVAGLKYLGISYMEWIKYIWKYALTLFALASSVVIVMSLFI